MATLAAPNGNQPSSGSASLKSPRARTSKQKAKQGLPQSGTLSLLRIKPGQLTTTRTHYTGGASAIDFKSATTGVAAKAMRNELNRLSSTISDPAVKKVRPPLLTLSLYYVQR